MAVKVLKSHLYYLKTVCPCIWRLRPNDHFGILLSQPGNGAFNRDNMWMGSVSTVGFLWCMVPDTVRHQIPCRLAWSWTSGHGEVNQSICIPVDSLLNLRTVSVLVVPPTLFIHIFFQICLSGPFPRICTKNKPSEKVLGISTRVHMYQNSFSKLNPVTGGPPTWVDTADNMQRIKIKGKN